MPAFFAPWATDAQPATSSRADTTGVTMTEFRQQASRILKVKRLRGMVLVAHGVGCSIGVVVSDSRCVDPSFSAPRAAGIAQNTILKPSLMYFAHSAIVRISYTPGTGRQWRELENGNDET